MNIGWLCPYVGNPSLTVGAVIEAEGEGNTPPEYIPVILPETPLGIAIARGPRWVIANMPDDFFAFPSKIQAEGFLFDTFEAHGAGLLSVRLVENLLDRWKGEPRNSSMYGVMLENKPHNLN